MIKKKRLFTVLVALGGILVFKKLRKKENRRLGELAQLYTKKSLTPDKQLKGIRELSEDELSGTYQASYENFTGEEILFGSHPMPCENKNITCTYRIERKRGIGDIFLQRGPEKTVLTKGQDGTVSFLCDPLCQYVSFAGINFEGEIELKLHHTSQ